MATSSDQEVKTNEKLEEEPESATNEAASGGEQVATSSDSNRSGISMFCKTCLHPYSGEQKSGTLVLRCERCGQTDVILEGTASDLKPEQWCGNLMMNRFLQVLKEQEDLCLNIADPFFDEDEFQRLHLAISEYTFNMKTVAERMYDIAKAATASLSDYYDKQREEMENDEELKAAEGDDSVVLPDKDKYPDAIYILPVKVRSHLKNLGATVLSVMEDLVKKYDLPLEILDKVKERVKSPEADDEGEGVDNDDTEGGEGSKPDSEEKVSKKEESMKSDEVENVMDDTTDLFESIGELTECAMPDKDMDDADKGEDIQSEGGEKCMVEGESGMSGNEEKKSIGELTECVIPEIEKEDTEKEKSIQPGVDETGKKEGESGMSCNQEKVSNEKGVGILETATEDAECGKLDVAEGGKETQDKGGASDQLKEAAENGTNNGSDAEADNGANSDEEDYTIFNISKNMLEQEVFDALAHKFALKWNNESNTDTQADNQTDEEDATESTNGEDAEDNEEDKTTKKVKESIDKTVYKDPDAANVRSVLNSVEGLRTFVLKTTHDAPPDDPDNETNDKEEEEVLEVNFYAVSSAFINELQERKRLALLARKDRALGIVNAKIAELKREVERVEDTVRSELTVAYEQKRKKVENQRRQLDVRHQQIQDAERRLDFYARTGQTDKLAALMEQLNVQYEN